MIPIKLEIEGLYSYQQKQIIDFTRLTQAGLFGIFGPVGSGKSSVLEAISFGLYGESERLNARDNRAYNMMNLKSNRSVIDLEFYNFEDKKYRIYRDFKRNSKRFDDVKRGDAVLYKWENAQWLPLPHLNIEKIVGLSYVNFKRTIIIPQGKFKEFIELGGKDRTQMMQEIFGLDRFDLAANTKQIYQTTKQNYDRLLGQLQGYSSLTEEQIEQQRELWKTENRKLSEYTVKFKNENDSFQQLKILKADFEMLKIRQNELAQLDNRLPAMQKIQKELEQYETLDKVFSNILREEKNFQNRYKLKQESLKKIEESLSKFQADYNEVYAKIEKIEPEFQKIEQLKTELSELNLFKEIKSADIVKKSLLTRQNKGKSVVQHQEDIFKDSQNKLTELVVQLNQAKADRIDPARVMSIDKWFNDFNYIQKVIYETEQTQTNLQQGINKIENGIKALKFTQPDQWKSEIQDKKNKLQTQKEKVEIDLNHLRVSQKLVQYAHDLNKGEACPLCGSVEHPNILQGEDITHAVEKLSLTQTKLKKEEEDLLQKERQMQITLEKRHLLEVELTEINSKINSQKSQLEQHQSGFIWHEIEMGNTEQLSQLKEKAIAINKVVEQLEELCEKQNRDIEEIRSSVERYKEALRKIELEYAKLETEIYAKRSQIRFLNNSELITLNLKEIELKIKSVEKYIRNTEAEYKKLQQVFQETSLKLTALQTEKKTTCIEIKELEQNIDEIVEQLESLMKKYQVNSKDEIFTVLSKQMNVVEIRKAIQEFTVQLEVIKNSVTTLTDKLKVVSFDENQYEKREKAVIELEQQMREQTAFTAKISGELERLERDFKEKKICF